MLSGRPYFPKTTRKKILGLRGDVKWCLATCTLWQWQENLHKWHAQISRIALLHSDLSCYTAILYLTNLFKTCTLSPGSKSKPTTKEIRILQGSEESEFGDAPWNEILVLENTPTGWVLWNEVRFSGPAKRLASMVRRLFGLTPSSGILIL